jgi:hypothetical protein
VLVRSLLRAQLVLQGEALVALVQVRARVQLQVRPAGLARAPLVQRAVQDRVRALVPPREATPVARPREADRAAARWR